MDNARLFRACKTGNLQVVRELLNLREIEFNIRDRWDSSPLYYACLCGHEEVVRFLLENGAICDANTFDGERCVYGALTKSIRNMLVRDYKVIARKVLQRRDFDEFLRKTLEYGEFFDIILVVNGVHFKLHRCLLSVRCEVFNRKLKDRWKNKPIIKLSNEKLTSSAFKVLLRFLYNGILDFPHEMKEDVVKMLRQCRFEQQINDIEAIGVPPKKLRRHNIQIEYNVNSNLHQLYQYSIADSRHGDCDIIFLVEKEEFRCHRLFICGRSDYFRALVQNHFSEAKRNQDGMPTFELHTVSSKLFKAFLLFLYTDSTELTHENVFDMLFLSDQYLVKSLKGYCSNFIEKNIDDFDAVELITISRSMVLPKLEKAATEYIANNLEDFLKDEHFMKLVINDAQNIRARQETDTIDIIDDVRYYLNLSKSKDIHFKFDKIDNFLNSLGLKA